MCLVNFRPMWKCHPYALACDTKYVSNKNTAKYVPWHNNIVIDYDIIGEKKNITHTTIFANYLWKLTSIHPSPIIHPSIHPHPVHPPAASQSASQPACVYHTVIFISEKSGRIHFITGRILNVGANWWETQRIRFFAIIFVVNYICPRTHGIGWCSLINEGDLISWNICDA